MTGMVFLRYRKIWKIIKKLCTDFLIENCAKPAEIGVTGFEPATSRPPAVRSSQTEPYPEALHEQDYTTGPGDCKEFFEIF